MAVDLPSSPSSPPRNQGTGLKVQILWAGGWFSQKPAPYPGVESKVTFINIKSICGEKGLLWIIRQPLRLLGPEVFSGTENKGLNNKRWFYCSYWSEIPRIWGAVSQELQTKTKYIYEKSQHHRMVFYVFKWLEKTKRSMVFCDIWKMITKFTSPCPWMQFHRHSATPIRYCFWRLSCSTSRTESLRPELAHKPKDLPSGPLVKITFSGFFSLKKRDNILIIKF